MTASVVPFPGMAPRIEYAGLNLSKEEVREAAGGYQRPADQLRELHARGFTRAYIAKVTGRVILERAHYDAVVRGQFGHATPAPSTDAPRKPLPPNEAGYKAKFGAKKRKQ